MTRLALQCSLGRGAESDGRRMAELSGPVTAATGGLLLAADLDQTGTAALATGLGLPAGADPGSVLAAAYLRWGPDMAHRLDGAFAIVIWDAARGRLTALRDRFGIKPLVYATRPGGIVLASDPARVIARLDHRPPPDATWIAEFLAGSATDYVHTAWQGIHRLPPGHLLNCVTGRVETRPWWRPEPQDLSPADATDLALQGALGDAAGAALDGGPVAVMLSGGLDSSSLALLAARRADAPLATYSLRFPDRPELDEGRHIASVLAAGRFAPRMIDGSTSTMDPALLAAVLAEQNQPFPGFGLLTSQMVYSAARADGHLALIDGHGGDEVIGSGLWHIEALARQGDWPQVWRMLRRLHRFAGAGSALVPFVQLLHRHARGRFVARWAGRVQRRLLAPAGQAPGPFALVAPDLAHSSDLAGRNRAAAAQFADLPPGFALHARFALGPMSAMAFEVLDRATRARGILPRYPFYDPRVVGLCLNRPTADKLAHGRPRALLREAMVGVLPETVRLRNDKANFMPNLRRAMAQDPGGHLRELTERPPERLAAYVHLPTLREAGQRILTRTDSAGVQDVFDLWRAAWLDLWLRHEAMASAPARVPA